MYPSNGIHFLHPIKSSVVFFIISHLSIILQLFIVLFYILFEGQNSCGQEVISLDTILRLRELMNSRGWSEYRLAKESKLSMSTISNIFHRGSITSITTLETLCNTFGISLGQFFSDGDEPISLTPEQKELLDNWSTLSDQQRHLVKELLKNM